MKSQALTKYFPHIELTEMGLILFFVFFVSMIVYVFSKKRAKYYEKVSRLPLEETTKPIDEEKS